MRSVAQAPWTPVLVGQVGSRVDFGTSTPMATLGEGHEIVIHSAGAGRREA
jgi:hypothetical protein